MGNVHVSPGLAPDQRICKPVSFYDLIDLMTFSQITFGRAEQMRPGGRRALALKQISWALLDDENALDWVHSSTPDSPLYLVSSIKALSMSLFPDNDADVFIEQIRRVIHLPSPIAPHAGAGSQHALLAKQTATLPLLEDDSVSIIVDTANSAAQDGAPSSQLRLRVDLGTLLKGVIVCPSASIRFVELVSQIVQRTTRAFVSRACKPCDSNFEHALSEETQAQKSQVP